MEKSSPSEADRRIVIGKIGAPHGVKGEMKIIPMTDFPERFDGMTHCYVDGKPVRIKSVRYQRKHVLMVFDGIETREGVHATPIIAKIMYHNNVDLSRIPHLYAMVVKELTLPWVIMPADILSSNIRQNLLN